MKVFIILVLAAFVGVRAQQQQAPKPQAEPVPSPPDQHSPGNPPPAQPGSPPNVPVVTNNANIPPANANQPPAVVATAGSNATSVQAGNTLTNVAVPKPEPPTGGEPKPKSEPPHDEHDHEHEHSPGNPHHMDGGVANLQMGQFILVLATIIPLSLTFLLL